MTVDVDFSLALHNRTGKYFIGRDLLDTPHLPLGDVYYWRLPRRDIPNGLLRRLLGRLQHWQIVGRTLGGPGRLLPQHRPDRPFLHLDPWTVPTTRLQRRDAVLCHDLGPITHPHLFDPEVGAVYARIYALLTETGPQMIFVSQSSRDMFTQLFPGADKARMRVIYPATRAAIDGQAPQPVAGIDGPFLLTVGSLGRRKNQQRCVEAFAQSGLAERGYRYVLCGAREPGSADVIAAAAATPGVVSLSYVSDAQLSWLYGEARGFVLASLLEGFGMPVAEAVARGLVPLVSQNSVLHEVAGNGALLTDPEDTGAIARAMVALCDMTGPERAARLAACQAHGAQFDLAGFRKGWRALFAELDAGSAGQEAAQAAR